MARLRYRDDPEPQKIGACVQQGLAGYANHGNFYFKRFPYLAGSAYPDFGCNFETFSNEDMLEIETLGPLEKLAPGGTVELLEHWKLHQGVSDFKNEKDIDRNILSRVRAK